MDNHKNPVWSISNSVMAVASSLWSESNISIRTVLVWYYLSHYTPELLFKLVVYGSAKVISAACFSHSYLLSLCTGWACCGQHFGAQLLLLLPQKFLVVRQWASLSLHSCNLASSDRFEVHKNLSTVEKYRCLLVWTNNFLVWVFFWFLQYRVSSSALGTFVTLLLCFCLTISIPIFLCIHNGIASVW